MISRRMENYQTSMRERIMTTVDQETNSSHNDSVNVVVTEMEPKKANSSSKTLQKRMSNLKKVD